jgi:hypothetical protein
MERIDQCVASLGVDRSVRSMTADLIVIDCPRSARTGLVQQPFDAVLQKASTPLPDRVLMDAEFARNGFARNAIRAS